LSYHNVSIFCELLASNLEIFNSYSSFLTELIKQTKKISKVTKLVRKTKRRKPYLFFGRKWKNYRKKQYHNKYSMYLWCSAKKKDFDIHNIVIIE